MKKNYTMKKVTIFLFVLLSTVKVYAQDDKIKFGAYGRALQQNNKLGEKDTLNIDNTSTGHVLVDLGVNINPDKRTEIQAIVRLKSDLGGFFGAGAFAQLRQLYVRGVIGKFINYQVGDIYLQLSPYTFFNSYSEGSVNEARIFSDIRRDYTNYENLSYRGNYWWQQGAHTNFALAYKESFLDTIRFDAFFLRNRNTNYFSIPTSFQAGGRVTITKSEKLKIAVNYVNLFDVGATISSDTSARNPVTSLQLDYKLWNNSSTAFRIFGEGGYSNLKFNGDTAKGKSDIFYEGGAGFDLKPANLSFTASYMYVGPEFFSSAAQSKRVNFNNVPSVFPVYGNDPLNPNIRSISIFDLVRDPSVYNAAITRNLMAYDPTLANAQPYGKATPNRKGFNLGIHYADSLQRIVADAGGSYLTDVVGVGSSELRKFMVFRGAIDFNIHKFVGFKKRMVISTGARYESTKRGGLPIEKVDLNSNLIDLGLELEVLKKFDLLVGAKMLMAKGNEFIPVRDKYNNIITFNNSLYGNVNVNQNLLAFGIKYRFSGNTYLTIQDHIFNYKDKTNPLKSYSLNQVLMLFILNF